MNFFPLIIKAQKSIRLKNKRWISNYKRKKESFVIDSSSFASTETSIGFW